MAKAIKIQQLLVADEASRGEFIAAPASATWTESVPFTECTFTPDQPRMPDETAQSRLAVRHASHIGARKCRIEFTMYWLGHGGTTAGALTQTLQQRLLKNGLGGGNVAQVGGTVNVPSSATAFTTTGATLVPGAVIRVGAKYDTRCDGQAAVVSTFAANSYVGVTALPATPAAADVVYVAQMAHHSEGASLVSQRFYLMHADVGAQWIAFGCVLSGIEITTPVDGGAKSTMKLTYEALYYERLARTFPDSLATSASDCAPVMGGSLFFANKGTATRTTMNAAEVTLRINLGLQPEIGQGGPGRYQSTRDFWRTGFSATLTLKEPWSTAAETFWDQANAALTAKHALCQANGENGLAYGWYAPNLLPIGNRPADEQPVNELGYATWEFELTEGSDVTSELTKSALRIWSA